METGIDGNCPCWPGASAVYSRAYRVLQKIADRKVGSEDRKDLIEALGKGDEERIKGLLLLFREYYPWAFVE